MEKGKTMPETNTITITLNEYMDMRDKANMSGFLMNEFARMEARFQEIDRRLSDLERSRMEK